MPPRWLNAIRWLGLCACLLFLGLLGRAQKGDATGLLSGADGPGASLVNPAVKARENTYIGSFRPNGDFEKGERLNCTSSKAAPPPARPAEVPPWIDLQDHREAIVENFAPPQHAVRVLQPKARTRSFVESFARVAYGREAILHGPTRIAVDSRQRVIVTDPVLQAIHVLDSEQPFRIAGGPGRRLQQPGSVAVDHADNIYVSDGKISLVQVFDRNGVFLRSLGLTRAGESIFQEPTGIAVDGEKDRLYVLDSPSSELFVLKLDGTVVQRFGGRRRRGGVSFELPREIAVRNGMIAVLDMWGSRVQLFDLRMNLKSTFSIHSLPEGTPVTGMGLALDAAGNFYVSNGLPGVRIYRHNGTLAGVVGNCDRTTPGIWIDMVQHLYLTDPSAGRILLFQQPDRTPSAGE